MTAKLGPWLVLAAVAGFLLLRCDSGSATVGTDDAARQLGFVLYTTRADRAAQVTVILKSSGIPERIPCVTFTGLDLERSGFDYWQCRPVTGDTTFSYTIVWEGDTLLDTLAIPARPDSLYCNEVYLPPSGEYLQLDSAASYTLRIATTQGPTGSFQLDGYLSAPSNAASYSLCARVAGDVYEVPTGALPGYEYHVLDIWVARTGSIGSTGAGGADRASNSMYVYYDIVGPVYYAKCRLP